MTNHSFSSDVAVEAMKGTPPVAIAGASLAGAVDWQPWVLMLTALYVLMQIGWLGWRIIDKARGKKVDDDG